MKRRTWVSLALVAVTLVACEKARDPGGSGAFDADDQAVFQYLPSGQAALFGGNYLKLQNFMQSTMGQLSTAMMAKMGPGMPKWMACFSDLKQLRLGGSMSIGGADGMSIETRMVFAGMTLDDVSRCAQQAGFQMRVDPDRKFASVELPAPAATAGYLVLPSGALYSRQAFAIAAAPKLVASLRPELEADQKQLGTTAADDPGLTSLIANVDRSKTFWFVGDAASTAAATKIGQLWGTIDLESGVGVDATIELKNAGDADKIEDSVKQVRGMADQMPSDYKDVVKSLVFERKGTRLHFGLKMSEAVLKGLMSQLGGTVGANLKP